MRLSLRRVVFVALLLIVGYCLFVFGCKAKQRGDSTSDSISKGASADSLFKIRYSPKWHPQTQFAGVYMAQRKGFYRDYGLLVEIQPVVHIEEAIQAAYDLKSDVIHIDLLTALKEVEDSTGIVNIAQISQNSAVMLIGKKSRGINSIADFQGKKIGLWRSGSNLISRVFLKRNRLQMKIIPIDWSISLFTQNVIDVINVMHYNEYYQLLQAGIKEEDLFVVPLSDPKYNIPDEGLYVTKQFYQANKAHCKAFAEATMDGWHYAVSHPEETLEVVLEIMQNAKLRANKSHQEWMLEKMKDMVMVNTPKAGILSRTDFANAISILKEFENYKRDLKYEEFYPDATK